MISLVTVLFLFFQATHELRHRVLHSAILRQLPHLKLHHIVVIQEPNKNALYTLDFTPINQSSMDTLLKLAIGQNVPAEVRLRYIEDADFMNDTAVIQSLPAATLFDNLAIENEEVRTLVNRAMLWTPFMNLYTKNCQHFSYFVKSLV